jgi:predicted dehydrogenase
MAQIKRIAIVGYGSIGKKHCAYINRLRPDIEILLVHSKRSQEINKSVLSSYISICTIEEAISIGVDGAIIASPASFHIEQASIFRYASIPLLIEKPISDQVAKAISFLNSLTTNDSPILVGYVLRYEASLRKFIKVLNSKIIGNLNEVTIECKSYLPTWRPNFDYRSSVSAKRVLGGGVLLELSHEIDYANWVFGPLRLLSSMLENSGKLQIDVEDKAQLNFISTKGVPISMNLDFSSETQSRVCNVTTSEGQLSWNGLENLVVWAPHNGNEVRWNFSPNKDGKYLAQLEHFFQCIEMGVEPLIHPSDALNTLKIIELARLISSEFKE